MEKIGYPKSIGLTLLLFFIIIVCGLVGCTNGSLGLRGGGISGSVVDSRTLVGIADVNVIAMSGEVQTNGNGNSSSSSNKVTKYARTDSNGKFYFSDMRSDEWNLSFDKVGYETRDAASSGTVKVVVVNGETAYIPQVRMVQNYINQYVTVKATLKDAVTGGTITYGNTNITIGKEAFTNRVPTELTAGFSVPASLDMVNITFSVMGYKNYSFTVDNLISDIDFGIITLQPESYNIVGRWSDVPGWVSTAGPTATIYAKSSNKVIATATSVVGGENGSSGFTLTGIPRGTSVSIEVSLLGYKMNSPITVYPDSDFQGTIYQNFSLKSNFSQILRDVRIYYSNNSISSGDRVGAYCEETGTLWPETTVTNPVGLTLGTPQVVDLGTQAIPTGYSLKFVGYMVENAAGTLSNQVVINDDGSEAQVVTIR